MMYELYRTLIMIINYMLQARIQRGGGRGPWPPQWPMMEPEGAMAPPNIKYLWIAQRRM